MKTKYFLACAFLLGALAINAQTKVYVYKTDKSATEYNISDIDSISFTAPAAGTVNYSKLKLNEVSGVGADSEKFYELINTGTVDINLEGCQIYYNANANVGDPFPPVNERLTWTGLSSQVIKAGELFSLIGRDNPVGTSPGSFTLGITPERIMIITLKDPAGNVIDQCIRAQDTGVNAVGRDFSMSRIPDGTGKFYFSIPTPNAKNGGSIVVSTTPPQNQNVDYTKLKLNEVNGVTGEKWFEIYNTGTETINLKDVTAFYSNSEPASYALTWTGADTDNIPGGGWFSTKGTALGKGLSANNANARLQLKAPDGTILDTYEKLTDINIGYSAIKDKAHARIPDGTGNWYYTIDAAGTPGATNGTNTAGYIKFGAEDGAKD